MNRALLDLIYSEGFDIERANSPAWLKFAKAIDANWNVPFNEKFVQNNTPLGEAVEEVLASVKDGIFDINDRAGNTIKTYLNALAVGCHYLCHSFKGHIYLSDEMEQYADLGRLLAEFYDYIVPHNALPDLAAYKNKSGGFQYLKESVDLVRYWELAQIEVRFLPRTALNMVKVPAIPRKIYLNRILALQRYPETSRYISVRSLHEYVILNRYNRNM